MKFTFIHLDSQVEFARLPVYADLLSIWMNTKTACFERLSATKDSPVSKTISLNSRLLFPSLLLATLLFSSPSLAARFDFDFTTYGYTTMPSLALSGVTITGSNDLNFESSIGTGMGVVNDAPNGAVSPFLDYVAGTQEYVDFTFSSPVSRVGFGRGASYYGAGTVSIEAFAPGNVSLGTVERSDFFSSDVTAHFGEQAIERFRVTPLSGNGIGITELTFDDAAPGLPTQLSFNVIEQSGFDPGSGPRQAFDAAVTHWSSKFSDPVEINLSLEYAADGFGSTTLGSASPHSNSYNFADYRAALVADATSADDATVVANLPATSVAIRLNRTSNSPHGSGSETPYVDTDNTSIIVTTAVAKAVGLLPSTSTGLDAEIRLNSGQDFDFDQSDGIDPGKVDATEVLIHEIGHALGFISNDFSYDGQSDENVDPRPLDLFRFTTESAAAGAIDFVTFDNTPDGSWSPIKYFSLDGGVTNLSGSPGFNQGSQPGHWAGDYDDGNSTFVEIDLGIMDPQSEGIYLGLSPLDIQAFDAIGWTVVTVPEPSSLMLSGIALAALLLVGLRRSREKTI